MNSLNISSILLLINLFFLNCIKSQDYCTDCYVNRPNKIDGYGGSFPFEISGCHEACYPQAKFAGERASATYTPQDRHTLVGRLQIKHAYDPTLPKKQQMINTTVEWLECSDCLHGDWSGRVEPNKEISWYKPSDDSIEPWCLRVIEPSYRKNKTGVGMKNKTDNGVRFGSFTEGEVDEKFQYIVRFWAKNRYNSEAYIYTTQCYMNKACGLCGYYNGNDTDDFLHRLNYTSATNLRFERYSFSYLIGDIARSWKPIVNILSPNISKSFYIENNDYGLLYLSSNNICNNNMYIYNPINCTKDISLKTNNTQSKLVFIAIIPSIIDSTASVALSNEIWTDNFDEFEDTENVHDPHDYVSWTNAQEFVVQLVIFVIVLIMLILLLKVLYELRVRRIANNLITFRMDYYHVGEVTAFSEIEGIRQIFQLYLEVPMVMNAIQSQICKKVKGGAIRRKKIISILVKYFYIDITDLLMDFIQEPCEDINHPQIKEIFKLYRSGKLPRNDIYRKLVKCLVIDHGFIFSL